MKRDKEKDKQNLRILRDAYSEALAVFHNVKHYNIEKDIHNALFPLNRAIITLEEVVNEEEEYLG